MNRPGFRSDTSTGPRVPPHSVDAEDRVLGALMMDPDAYWAVETILKPEDFYLHRNQLIYLAIRDLASNDKVHDSLHVADYFETRGTLETVGGSTELVDLQVNAISSANVQSYANIVASKAVLRRLVEAGMHLINKGFEPGQDEPAEVAAEAVSLIEAADRRIAHEGTPIRQVLVEVYENIQRTCDWEEGRLTGLRFGYPQIEEMIDGLQPRRTYGIGARTKMGKTILLENIATNLARGGSAAGVWSLEMGEVEWGMRQLAHVSGVQEEKLKRGRLLGEEDWSRLTASTRELRELKYRLFDNPMATLERIAAQATMLKARGELDVVVVDYLQIMAMASKAERRDLDIGHNSWGLKQLAKRLDVPVVFAFQIGRGNETGHQVRAPRPSDARESGNIEQDLDVMILLHRPGYYDKVSKGVRCEIALNRSGSTGIVRLEEDLTRCRFLPSNRQWTDNETENLGETGF